jgi:hypothetical protein
MLNETRIVEEALLATPSADRPKSIAHHRCCDTTASAERHRKEPSWKELLDGFHVSVSLCSCVWRPWLLPYTISVMQRWISYSAKTLRAFLGFLS